MKITMYAARSNEEPMIKMGQYDSVDDIQIPISMFSLDVTLFFRDDEKQASEDSKVWRKYERHEITSANIKSYITLSGTAQFTEHIDSSPILTLEKAIMLAGGCDRMIMNQKVYNALNIHPEIQSAFQKIKEGGGAVKDDGASTMAKAPKVH